MRPRLKTVASVFAGLAIGWSAPAAPQAAPALASEYVRLQVRGAEALLYRPASGTPVSRIAYVYVHPNGNTFSEPLGPQMAARGHLALMVNYRSDGTDRDDQFAPAISAAIRSLRQMPGVEKVVLTGHSGGGHLTAWYTNAALNGPTSCNGPDKIYPCDTKLSSGLEKPDGLILLDPTLGTFHQANSIDPAAGGARRIARLDMFATINGYDSASRKAAYPAEFIVRFNKAQAVRSAAITAQAQARLKLIEAGKGRYRDDEPLVINGMGNLSAGARLFQPDARLLARTRGNHVTLMADGSRKQGPVVSVRPSLGSESAEAVGTLSLMTRNTTVRQYLAASAIRFGPDFSISADNITGVDWGSAAYSTPGNARGITVPTLVMSMSCHYLIVPDEIIFENLAAKDKTYLSVEGATHLFQPCRKEFGDTMKRTFDAVEEWSTKEGRF